MSDERWDEINRLTLDHIAESPSFRKWMDSYFAPRPFERAIRESAELDEWARREREIGR